jgi:hypothetical protein
MTGVFDPDWADPRTDIKPAQRPATIGEAWTANRVLARGDRMDAEADRLRREYEPILTAINADRARRKLKPMVNPGYWVGGMDRRPSADNGAFDFASMLDPTLTRDEQQAAIFKEIGAIRQRDGAFLKDVPSDVSTFRQAIIDREKAARAQARDVTDRASGIGSSVVGFAGGVWETMHDPVNIASMPLGGGGTTIVAKIGRSALLNGALELAQQPGVAIGREQLGEELTLGEALLNTGMGAVGGVVGDVALPALGKAAIKGVGKAIDATLPVDRRIAVALGRADIADATDADVAAAFAARVPQELRTPDESAAIHVIEREAEIRDSSPFIPTVEGLNAHAARMQTSMEALVRANTAEAVQIVTPSMPARLRSSGGRLANDVVTFFKAKGYSDMHARGIAAGVAAEAASNHSARNPTSGAFGLGQWLGPRKAALFRRYGSNPTRQQQLEFLHWELQGGDHGGKAVLRQGDEAGVLSAYINDFMRPAKGAETTGDLQRGMAALGREGEGVPARAIDVEGGLDGPVARPAALDAEAPLVARPEALSTEIDYADLPQVKPELFARPDERDIAQAAIEGDLPPITPRAAPVRRAPMDLFQFLASKGGIANREGHDLTGMFGRNPFVPGIGALVRDSGLSIDRARELAVEAGYFGDPNRTDVTTADLLDVMDRQHRGGQRLFAASDLNEVEARRQRLQQSEGYGEFDQRLRDVAGARGIDDLDEADALRAFELWDGQSFEATLDRVIAEHIDQAHMEYLAEVDPTLYDQARQLEELGYGARRPEDGSDPGWIGEPDPDAGNARQDGEGVADGGGPAAPPRSPDDVETGLIVPDQKVMARWDDPDGEAVRLQADSLDHDLRALIDPAIAERQLLAAQLGAEAPLRGSSVTGKEQDGTMGLGLFDAIDQPGFRLEDGSEATLADIFADLDEDAAMIATIRSCL